MFTGLIREVGGVVSLTHRRTASRLTVSAPSAASTARNGDSVAVNGVCLTVVSMSGSELSFDVSRKTAEDTTLSLLSSGDSVNIEPALAAGDRLGGHFVGGLVETTGRIHKLSPPSLGADGLIEVECDDEFSRLLFPKGHIAVDGISLTIQEAEGGLFSSILVPHTWEMTNLSNRRKGELVNLEFDIIVKAALHGLDSIIEGGEGVTFEKLREWGY